MLATLSTENLSNKYLQQEKICLQKLKFNIQHNRVLNELLNIKRELFILINNYYSLKVKPTFSYN